MKLLLVRDNFTSKCTQGKLYVDGVYLSETLEDVVRAEKIKGETAIPDGAYPVVLDFSQRFQKELPHLQNVPGFDGVRIHWGNSDRDTEGCILVGYVRGLDWLGESKAAFGRLMDMLKSAKDTIEISVTSATGGRGA